MRAGPIISALLHGGLFTLMVVPFEFGRRERPPMPVELPVELIDVAELTNLRPTEPEPEAEPEEEPAAEPEPEPPPP
ncbi:MAG: hypothetical protein HXY25_04815, partial [Alphaproteobacteria bacterium]|nr:hypothetical protein [Alphaproteobacteria bacterium]